MRWHGDSGHRETREMFGDTGWLYTPRIQDTVIIMGHSSGRWELINHNDVPTSCHCHYSQSLTNDIAAFPWWQTLVLTWSWAPDRSRSPLLMTTMTMCPDSGHPSLSVGARLWCVVCRLCCTYELHGAGSHAASLGHQHHWGPWSAAPGDCVVTRPGPCHHNGHDQPPLLLL